MKTVIKGLMMLGGLTAMVGFVPAGSARAHTNTRKHQSGTVTVDNTRGVKVSVYLDENTYDVPLGTVAPHAEATLTLPRYLLDGDQIGFIVHPTQGEDLNVEDVTFRQGKNLDLYVPSSDDGYIPPPPPETIPNPGKGTTTLTVQNPRNQDLMVTLQRGPFNTRLGVAPANRETTLVIPPSLTLGDPDVEIFLRPKGGLDLDTATFTLDRDAHLLLKVPAE